MTSYLLCEDSFKVVHPMKYCGTASQTKINTVLTDKNYVLQEKYDGAFFQLMKNEKGQIGLFSRTISRKNGEYVNKIANVPWLEDWAAGYLPDDSILIGEIYIPGGKSNNVTSIMGCLPAKAIERQKTIDVHYMVFDCIRWSGEDLCGKGFFERYTVIENHFADWIYEPNYQRRPEDPRYDYEMSKISIVPIYTLGDCGWGIQCETWTENGWTKDETFANHLSLIFANGGEGAVLKHKDSIYRPGMRTTVSQAFKVKEHVDAVDLVIMDVLDPEMEYKGKEIDSWEYWGYRETGGSIINTNPECIHDHMEKIAVTKPYYHGWKNTLKLGAYNNEGNLVEVCRVASGLTDDIRASLGADPGAFIGSVCKISCMSLNKKDHTVRHPVFVGFHDDKSASDCKIEEVFA